MTKRKLKIGYNTRTLQANTPKRKTEFIPQLILQGKWLQRAGFTIGEFVKVTVADGLINIINSTKAPIENISEEKEEHAVNDFREFIDSLHFDGYSESLQYTHPDQFKELYNQYIFNHGSIYR